MQRLMEFKDYFSKEVPILLVGPPGIGKTECVLKSFDYVETLLLSSCQSEDIGGLPYRENEFDYKTIPSIFQRLDIASKEGKTTALFLDELDKASREVSDTLLTLVCNRRSGRAILPENTCIIAAANPSEYGGGDGISIPMLNRFAVIEYEICKKSWANWARKEFGEEFEHLIIEFENGNLPLFDSRGEDLNIKTTSPRSIALAFKAIKRLKNDSKKVVEGLLTPMVAQKLINKLDFSSEYKDIIEKTRSLLDSVTTTKNKKSIIKPLEL